MKTSFTKDNVESISFVHFNSSEGVVRRDASQEGVCQSHFRGGCQNSTLLVIVLRFYGFIGALLFDEI